MKKTLLLLLMAFSFLVAKSQCSSIYGLSLVNGFSLIAIDRYTGTIIPRDTLSTEPVIQATSTIEPDSNRFITLAGDNSGFQHIYTIDFNTGQVLYQPVCDSILSELHYDVKRKEIFALLEHGITSSQWSLVTINPYNGNLTILDTIPNFYMAIPETSTIGIDSGRYYIMGMDTIGFQWLYALDELTGQIKYKQHDSNVFECEYDTISKNIYCLTRTGNSPYVWYFNSLTPSTGVVTVINSLPGLQLYLDDTKAFAQDSLNYFFLGDTSATGNGPQMLYTINAPTGNILRSPVLGPGTLTYFESEYAPCNSSYCTNTYNEPICMATVDTATNKAEVIWGRTNSPPATGSYNIYKDSTSGYMLIHNQALNALSEYIDTSSYPSDGPISYKLSCVDSCGESTLSVEHTTMHLTTTSGVNVYILNWTPYVGFTPTVYRIFRGLSMNALVQIDSVPATTLTFHDTLPPAGSIYLVEAVNPAGTCIATPHRPMHLSPLLSGSFSNGYNAGALVTATNEVKGESEKVKVYPNPNNGIMTIQWSVVSGQSSDVQISIINELGQIIYTENKQSNIGTNTEQLNLGNLASGIYTLRMETNSSITVRKLEIIANKNP